MSSTISLDSCRKVFVERDYSLGLTPRFVRDLPFPLEGIINQREWEHTIDTINREFSAAEKVTAASIGETIFSYLSCYIYRLFTTTVYDRQLARIRSYIYEQNQKVFIPNGLHLTDPTERGMRVIEVSILTTGQLCSPTATATSSSSIRAPTKNGCNSPGERV